MRAGCLDCLVSALNEYESLLSIPGLNDEAAEGAFRAALLAGVRERELGTPDDGYLDRARQIAAKTMASSQTRNALVDAAETIPLRSSGPRVQDEEQLARAQRAYRSRDAWLAAFRPHVGDDPGTAYIWLSLNCAYNTPTRESVAAWVAELPLWSGVPLPRVQARDVRRRQYGDARSSVRGRRAFRGAAVLPGCRVHAAWRAERGRGPPAAGVCLADSLGGSHD